MNSNKNWKNKLILDPSCEELFIDNRLRAGLLEFDIQLGGISTLKKNYLVERECCKYHSLIYTVSGQASLKTDKLTQTIPANSLLLLPAGSRFSYELIDSQQWQIVWFLIDDSKRWQCLKNKGMRLEKNNSVNSIYHLSQALYQEITSNKPQVDLVSLNAKLLYGYINKDLATSSKLNIRNQQTLHDFFNQLESKIQQSWTLNRLAELAGYSTAQFNRLCIQELQLTPMKKLRNMRMQRAKALLNTTELNLSDIASAVGYKDVFNFSSSFKRELGISPNTYRNK